MFILITIDNQHFHLFVINNYFDENIKIRHYLINNYNLYQFKIIDELNLNLYHNFLSMVFEGEYSDSDTLASLIIFSYPNCSDFSVDVSDDLISFSNPIIKFSDKCILENNIFGYIIIGIKIYDYTNGL